MSGGTLPAQPLPSSAPWEEEPAAAALGVAATPPRRIDAVSTPTVSRREAEGVAGAARSPASRSTSRRWLLRSGEASRSVSARVVLAKTEAPRVALRITGGEGGAVADASLCSALVSAAASEAAISRYAGPGADMTTTGSGGRPDGPAPREVEVFQPRWEGGTRGGPPAAAAAGGAPDAARAARRAAAARAVPLACRSAARRAAGLSAAAAAAAA